MQASAADDTVTIWGAELGNVRPPAAPRPPPERMKQDTRARAAPAPPPPSAAPSLAQPPAGWKLAAADARSRRAGPDPPVLPAKQITLVAKVVRIQDTSTQMTYTLDDGTGRIDVKMWVEDDAGEANAALKEQLRAGTYARAIGSLRHFQGAKSFVAYSMRPVADMNEVTFHGLEVICVSKQLKLKHGGGGGHFGAAGAGLMAGGAPPANAAYGAYAAPKPAGGGSGGGGAFTGGFSGNISADVLSVFNSDLGRGDTGVALGAVAAALQGKYTMDAIRAAVEAAVNDGHLYSTIDDNHYKCTAY